MTRLRATVAIVGVLWALPALAYTYTARVIGVTDGDTVKVLDRSERMHKIRLAWIDAPERSQPFGQRSKQHLADQLFGRDVTLECGEVDRYRRQVCVVLLDGRDVNLLQVQAGYAWWYRPYARKQRRDQQGAYAEAESAAQARRAGLWQGGSPTPPWVWRKRGPHSR